MLAEILDLESLEDNYILKERHLMTEGVMKKIIILFVLVVFQSQLVTGQNFGSKSKSLELNITHAAFLDTIKPIVDILDPQPNIITDKPIYVNTPNITLKVKVSDNRNHVYLDIRGSRKLLSSNQIFTKQFELNKGINEIHLSAFDKKSNTVEKSLLVYYDPQSDTRKPEIDILAPNHQDRGIQIVASDSDQNDDGFQTSDSVSQYDVKVRVYDESKLYKVTTNYVPMKDEGDGIYSLLFYPMPDTLKVIAIDEWGNTTQRIHSSKVAVTYPIVQGYDPQILTTGEYHALIIAIQDYRDKGINKLVFPIKDAEKLKNVLVNKYIFDKENIYMLNNPTRREIFSALSTLEKNLNWDDNLLVFYAGHGIFQENSQQGYWLPSDATKDNRADWISNSDIRDYIRSIKTKHTLLIADACFSGSIFQSRNAFVDVAPDIKLAYKTTSRKAMTSGYVQEVPDKSVFIEYLIKRLDENQDRYLTSEILFTRFKSAVTNNSYNNQTPVYGTIQNAGDEGNGDFIFIKR